MLAQYELTYESDSELSPSEPLITHKPGVAVRDGTTTPRTKDRISGSEKSSVVRPGNDRKPNRSFITSIESRIPGVYVDGEARSTDGEHE